MNVTKKKVWFQVLKEDSRLISWYISFVAAVPLAGAEFEVKKRELMNTLAELRQQDKEKKHQERRFERINVALNEER